MRGLYIGLGLARPRRSASVFTPASIANLAVWYDAADSLSITHSGGSVSQWNDKSGNGYHAAQASAANKPLTGMRSHNSVNVIDFDGNDALVTATFGSSLLQPTTVFLFGKFDTAASIKYMYDGLSMGNRQAFFTNFAQWDVFAGVEMKVAGNTNAQIHVIQYNGASSRHYANGVLIASGNVGSDPLGGLTLGSRFSISDQLDGFIGELAMYGRLLTNAEINRIGTYLASKWGMTWTNI